MNRSPLGKYAQIVAAIAALAILGSDLLALLFNRVLTIDGSSLAALDRLATFALGAIFASAAVVNGVKEPIESAHYRIDKLERGTGIDTHGVYPEHPENHEGQAGSSSSP